MRYFSMTPTNSMREITFHIIFYIVLGHQPQQAYSTSQNLVTQSGPLIFTNGLRKASIGAPKSSLHAQELTFQKHLITAGGAAGEPFVSGSNRTSAISEKRSSVFDTASLPSGNGNNQPETAPAMLLVQSQQVSKPLSLAMPRLEHRGISLLN